MGRLEPGGRQRVILLLACVLILGLAQLGLPATGDWLRYDRLRIEAGELWRLLSAHLVHLGWEHWALNCTGLVLIFALYWKELTPATLCWWASISGLCVGLGLLTFAPSVLWYVGLSGVLHGLLVAGAVAGLRGQTATSVSMLVLVTLKLAWEQLWGPVPGSMSASGGPVVVDAHLYGALGGLAAGLLRPVVPPAVSALAR